MTDWRTDASCAGMGKAWDALEQRDQLKMCAGCPVSAECLELGMGQSYSGMRWGKMVFGGKTHWQLVKLRWERMKSAA